MIKNCKAVIFDLDGTLVDSMWIWKAIDIEYLKRFGITCPEKLQDNIEGMSFSEVAAYFKEHFSLPDEIEKIKSDWNEMAFHAYTHEVPLKEGVLEFLSYLKANNIKTGIATSNSKELVTAVIKALNVEFYFDEIHTSCEVKTGKPAPDIYLLVAKCLGVAPSDCVVFEDLPLGIRAGVSAGMTTYAIEDNYSKHMEQEKRELADYYIKSYFDLDVLK